MLLSSAFLFHFHGCPWACVDLVLMNSLSFCLSRKVFISPSFLKDDFAGYSILSWQVYSFGALNISSHSLPSCIISAKKFSDNIMGSPLWHLCLAAFRSLSLSFDSLNTKVWACLDSSSLESLDVHFLPQIWGVLAISSSSKLSVSLSLPLPFFSETPIMHILIILLVSRSSLRHSSPYFIIFCSFYSYDFKWLVFKFAYSFFCLIIYCWPHLVNFSIQL